MDNINIFTCKRWKVDLQGTRREIKFWEQDKSRCVINIYMAKLKFLLLSLLKKANSCEWLYLSVRWLIHCFFAHRLAWAVTNREKEDFEVNYLSYYFTFNFLVTPNWHLKSDKKFCFHAAEIASFRVNIWWVLNILFINTILPEMLITLKNRTRCNEYVK